MQLNPISWQAKKCIPKKGFVFLALCCGFLLFPPFLLLVEQRSQKAPRFSQSLPSLLESRQQARAHAHKHESRRSGPGNRTLPKPPTKTHSSTAPPPPPPSSVSQSVSQISKSQNARPPECQIPRWWNPRNALRKNQPYKDYHRNDDEREKKKNQQI